RTAAPILTTILALLASPRATLAGPSSQPHGFWYDTPDGQVLLREFQYAPFPHASRDNGFRARDGTLYAHADHYIDGTIGILIPRSCHPSTDAGVDLIVHFHGHMNHVESVIDSYHLAEQLAVSRRNAILLVPQGPKDAPDSGSGKMEDP